MNFWIIRFFMLNLNSVYSAWTFTWLNERVIIILVINLKYIQSYLSIHRMWHMLVNITKQICSHGKKKVTSFLYLTISRNICFHKFCNTFMVSHMMTSLFIQGFFTTRWLLLTFIHSTQRAFTLFDLWIYRYGLSRRRREKERQKCDDSIWNEEGSFKAENDSSTFHNVFQLISFKIIFQCIKVISSHGVKIFNNLLFMTLWLWY